MLGVTDYAAFVVAFIILLAIPGPGNLALILSTGKEAFAVVWPRLSASSLVIKCCCGWR